MEKCAGYKICVELSESVSGNSIIIKWIDVQYFARRASISIENKIINIEYAVGVSYQ